MFKAFFARLPDKIASTPIISASVTITRMVGHLISEDLVQVTLLLNIEQDDDKKKKKYFAPQTNNHRYHQESEA